MTGTFVLVTLAPARRRWVRDLSRWTTSGELAAEAVVCLSADEVRALVGSGRVVSLVLVDAGAAGLDRDLVAAVRRHGAEVLVVDDGRTRRDWEGIGCTATLAPPADAADLRAVLDARARRVEAGARQPAHVVLDGAATPTGAVVSVVGTGGAGASTAAAAVAQGLVGRGAGVALVDGRRRADQTVLHDPGDVVPGLVELVEMHRNDVPDPAAIRDLLRPVANRGYDLLPGLRRPREWALLRPLSLAAALDSLTRAYPWVVVDHDDDLDGLDDTGSADAEERHALARWAVDRASVVLLVGRVDLAGLHRMASVRADLHDAGVPPERVLTVLGPARGARLGAAGRPDIAGAVGPYPTLLLGRVRGLEVAHRAVAPLPRRFVRPLAHHVSATLDRLGLRPSEPAGVPVRPGELGTRLDGEVA